MPRGRQSGYDPGKHPIWGWSLAVDGKTDDEIARKFEITRSTLYEWKKKYPELSDAIKNGKEPVDGEVKHALKKRAVGFHEKERRRIIELDPATGDAKPVRIEEIERYYPPDTAAAFIWLKNRDPKNWKDKHEIMGGSFEQQAKMISLADLINNPAPNRELPE